MQISNHYAPYEKKTLVVVTNNEVAKIFELQDREINLVSEIKAQEIEKVGRSSGKINDGPKDFDEEKRLTRVLMYKDLSEHLLGKIQKEQLDLILCAPEAYKNEIFEQMHSQVQKVAKEIVPKNLASLPLDQIIRILQEIR
jgi:stalled ribosome rescue protein Dom34